MQDLIDAEMKEYYEGAYADHGCAKDQLTRFAQEVAEMKREEMKGKIVARLLAIGALEDGDYIAAIRAL